MTQAGVKRPAVFFANRRYGARAWMISSILVPLVLLAGASYWDRQAILGGARERLRSTTEALAEHAQTVMETASLALDLELAAIRQLDWAQIGQSEPLHAFLVRLVQQLPQLQSAFYVDPKGINSVSSRAFPMPSYDVSAREYFEAAKAGVTAPFISAPFAGQAAGTVGFTISQARIQDGRFDGLAAVTLSPQYFRRFYEAVVSQRHSGAILLRSDGVILVRYPQIGEPLARIPPTSHLLRLAALAPSGSYQARSLFDGRIKLIEFQRVNGQPLIVSYALDKEAVLAPWYAHIIVFALFAAIASGALMMIGRRMMLQAESDQASLRALVAETDRRRQAEAALQHGAKMEALGRLTGGVAHDFNNLLAAILGSVELALRRNTDPRLTRLLTVAQQAAQRGAKLTTQMLAFARKQRTWSAVLRRVPESRFVLKSHALADPKVAERIRAAFASHGICADRLGLRGPSPHRDFLAQYADIDIALDTFPYCGGLTTVEALWMGVPTITVPGSFFAARHSLSHLSNAGLADWAAPDLAGYVEMAVRRASDVAALSTLRGGLRARVRRSPLCDAPRFGRNLGSALRHAWRQWCASR